MPARARKPGRRRASLLGAATYASGRPGRLARIRPRQHDGRARCRCVGLSRARARAAARQSAAVARVCGRGTACRRDSAGTRRTGEARRRTTPGLHTLGMARAHPAQAGRLRQSA